MWELLRRSKIYKFDFLFSRTSRVCFIGTKTKKVTKESRKEKNLNIQLAQDLSGLEYDKAHKYALEHPHFQKLDPDRATTAVHFLKSSGIDVKEILKYPTILSMSSSVLRNRYQILHETGFRSIQLHHIQAFRALNKTTISDMKLLDLIDPSVDVVRRLLNSFELDTVSTELHEMLALKTIRETILLEYMRRVLDFSETNVSMVHRPYLKLNNSALSILEMVKILKQELNFDNQRIQNNAFALYADPLSVKEVLKNFTTIGGIDIKTLLYRRPKVIMQSAEAIQNTLKILKKFQIPISAITLCPEILTLSTQTITERLTSLSRSKDFDCLMNNPRILKLVFYYKKAHERLEQLQALEFKCVSLNLLISRNECFERYIHENVRKRKGNDVVIFLANQFWCSEDEVRKYISRHLYWKCVPLSIISENLAHLVQEGYSKSDIFKQIFLLLYPVEKLANVLSFLRNDVSFVDTTPSRQLSLVLYLLEKDFYFSGDGVWPDFENQEGQQTDICDSGVETKLGSREKAKNL